MPIPFLPCKRARYVSRDLNPPYRAALLSLRPHLHLPKGAHAVPILSLCPYPPPLVWLSFARAPLHNVTCSLPQHGLHLTVQEISCDSSKSRRDASTPTTQVPLPRNLAKSRSLRLWRTRDVGFEGECRPMRSSLSRSACRLCGIMAMALRRSEGRECPART
jgi:hypothetical protein